MLNKLQAKERARNNRLKLFNLTAQEWQIVSAYQNHVCRVCHRTQKSGKRLATDHSHQSGMVRNLLCSTCNRALGRIERSWPNDLPVIAMLERVIDALRNPSVTAALGRSVYTFPGRFGTKRHKKYLQDVKSKEKK